MPTFGDRSHEPVHQAETQRAELRVQLERAHQVRRDGRLELVPRPRVEDLRYQLPHRGTFIAQEAVNLGKDESGNDHGRRGRERLRVVGPRGTTSRSPGECAEETARVGDRRSAHFSMSLKSSDSSPSLSAVETKSSVDGGRRPR